MEIDLSIDNGLVLKILTGFIRSETGRFGFSRAVVNLSGGLDSSVACALAARALGPQNVLALRLPYKTSAQDSLDHAQLLIEQLGVQSLTLPITSVVDALVEHQPEMNQVRKGNIMARVRMIAAYDQSEAFKGLVIGTGNKTEILLGYTTLYGDSACAFNPIGDLYKTQVFELARHLDIPEAIVAKKPSADLWPGQTDEDEIGISYADLDIILHLMIDRRWDEGEIVERGYPLPMIRRIKKMIADSQFKRTMPPVTKLSVRTVGIDFRYLRDWNK